MSDVRGSTALRVSRPRPPPDEFKTAEQLRQPDTYYPLQVWICEDCGLTQIGYVVAPEIFYQNISSLMSDLPFQAEGKHV